MVGSLTRAVVKLAVETGRTTALVVGQAEQIARTVGVGDAFDWFAADLVRVAIMKRFAFAFLPMVNYSADGVLAAFVVLKARIYWQSDRLI